MERPNDYNIRLDSEVNKLSTIALGQPKTHAFIIVAGKCLLPVDDILVQKLGIKDGDAVYQEVDDKGSIRLVFKDIRNRSAGSGYHANPADDSTASYTNLHEHE
jgi:hypothetical protein